MSGSDSVTLNCWIVGDDTENIFSVDIEACKNISQLKEKIKHINPEYFSRVDVRCIVLWKVEINLDADPGVLHNIWFHDAVQGGRKLKSWHRVNQIFSSALEDQLHIVVQHFDKSPIESQSRFHGDDLTKARFKWIERYPAKPPSEVGKYKEFSSYQAKSPPAFYFDRPPTAAVNMPIILYDPILGQFQEDCKSYTPTYEDYKFVSELSTAMSDFFDSESLRAEKARDIMKRYGIGVAADTIDGYRTDGDVRRNGFAELILEYKLEIGAGGAEPLLQGAWYYTAIMRHKLLENPDTCLPCLIMYAFGPHIGFAGAIWTDRPHIQVLTPTLPLFYHHTDGDMIHRIARYFGAAKKAISALDEYYHRGLPAIKKLDPAKRPNVSYPYPRQYQSLVDGTVHTFKYSAPVQQDKLIFRARDGNVDICVKFVRRYSKEAHLKCASMGFAPRLMGFEKVPRGWYMVVMEYLDDTYQDLDDSQFRAGFSDQLLANLVALHQAGYAHGDIRGPNIMVRKTGQGRALLVDFDWAGVINEVRYPMYLNEDLVRPEGAAPGELIAAEHDMKMLHIIFDPPKRSDV